MTELVLSRLDPAPSFGNPAVCVSDMVQPCLERLSFQSSRGYRADVWRHPSGSQCDPRPHPAPSLPQDSRAGDLSRAACCWWRSGLDSGCLPRTPRFSHPPELFKWVLNCLWTLPPFYPLLASKTMLWGQCE